MLYAFIDESERDEAFYFLSAVVCTDEQAHSLSMKLHRIMGKHAKSHPLLDIREESHASAMMRAEEQPWRQVPLRLRLRIYTEALEAIRDSGCRIYIEGIDIAAQKARGYKSLTPPRELALGYLLERVNDCGREAIAEPVRVVADQHHTSEVSRSNFNNYRLLGTPGYRSSTLPHIESPLQFAASHTSRLLQAADLVTYIYNRQITIRNRDPRAMKAQEALWQTVAPAAQWPRGRARVWP